nr:head GIN domain-containing protein [uncultured Flavobacterium sp.]
MKNIALATIALITFNLQAQVEKNVGDFSEIRTTNRIKVELIPSTENKVILNSEDEGNVSLVNKNGRLAVKNKIKELVSDSDFKVSVKVYFKSLNTIEAESGSYIFSTKEIEFSKLKLNSSSGSQLDIKINAKNVEAKVFAGATMELQGKADTGTLIANAGGFIDAKDLNFTSVDATVNAGGKIDVKATETVNATTRAGGNINVFGNPKTITEKTTAGGNIHRVK